MTMQISYQDDTLGRGWNAWDSDEPEPNPADAIPGTNHLGPDDFEQARTAAVAAWGNQWADAQLTDWVSA